jgi:hypothetical protein
MPSLVPAVSHGSNSVRNITGLTSLIICAALIAGCGSTKVYTPDKTVVYKDAIYNVSDVKRLSTRLETVPASGDPVDLRGYDKKRFEALVKETGPAVVRSVIVLDDAEIVYQQSTLAKWGDFNRMQDALSDVQKELTKFMGDGKKTQLKL